MDILYLIDRLENLVAGSRRMPLVNQIMIKEADIQDIIEQMRLAIPEEVKQARNVSRDKERILAQAQADASALLARAREESERAMNREGLLKAAQERSQEILREAELKAEQLKNEADLYVVETLRALRDHLTSIETDIDRSILSIERGLESMGALGEEGERVEASEYIGDEEEPPQNQRPVPRRASLAMDTMGGPMYSQEPPSRNPVQPGS